MQSIDDQINRLKDLAKELNLNIVKIYTEAKSAKKPNIRPIFNEVLERIEKGEAEGILCWQINRLSRNPIDSGRLGWMLQEGKLKSIQTIDRQYLPEDNVIMFSVESGMANQFIIDLRKNTKRGLAGKAERGWFPGTATQGYKNDVINKTIIKDPEKFDQIRKMWDLMLTGNYSVSKISKIVNKEWGYISTLRKRYGGRPLSLSEFYRIFKDRFYSGYFYYGGKLYKGNHEPMITVEEFERVQEILGRKNKPKMKTHDFAFTGIIRCGFCGCLITAEEKKKFIKSTKQYAHYTYYHCTRKKREMNCMQTSTRAENLEDQIIKELEKITIPEEFKDWALEVIKSKNDKEIEGRSTAYEILNKNYLEFQKQLDNLTRLRLRELLTDEEFIRERSDLQEKITKVRERLDQNQDRGQNWVDLVERAFNFAAYARKTFINTKDMLVKREILSTLGQNFILKDGKLSIEPIEWLNSISNLNNIEKNETIRLEPASVVSNNAQTEAFASASTLWGARADSNCP